MEGMEKPRNRNSMRANSKDKSGEGKNLNLVDVYDMAADIGKEFEELIDKHGPEQQVTELMKKVISALEQLEVLVQRNDSEQMLIEDLKRTIEHLEHEDTKKNDERHKYAKDIEQVEEHYKEETKDYLTTIKRLQDENRKLSSSLTAATERDSAFSEDESSYIEIDLVNKLQSIVERQREQIRSLDNDMSSVKSDLEDLRGQNERLSSSNKEHRRKLRQNQTQMHCLVDERAELQVALQDQQRETQILARRLGLAAKENADLAQSANTEPDLTGKVVYSVDDPNRPRFTLAELKDILQERNSLKAKVSDLEDELELYRPSTRCKDISSSRSSSNLGRHHDQGACDCAFHSGTELQDHFSKDTSLALEAALGESDSDTDSGDRPVQGPMPYEPEDAPWKKSETSGIRKFFRRLFGPPNLGIGESDESCDTALSPGNLKKSFSKFNFL